MDSYKYYKYKIKYIELKNKLTQNMIGGVLPIENARNNVSYLTSIVIDQNTTADEIHQLSLILPTNTHIVRLYIKNPTVSIGSILSLLANNNTIISALYIENNIDIDALTRALISNNTIKEFIYNGSLTTENLFKITKMLEKNKTINYFGLYNNNLNNDRLQLIINMLAVNKSIYTLKLYGNEIDNIGAQLIANMLAYNTTLTTLDLDENNIDDTGVQAIATSLTINKKIQKLYLGNLFGQIGINAIRTMLETNRTILEMSIPRHNTYINQALQRNRDIFDLYVKDKQKVKSESYSVDVADTISLQKEMYLPRELWDYILRLNLNPEQITELIKIRKQEKSGEKPRAIDNQCPCLGACSGTQSNPCVTYRNRPR